MEGKNWTVGENPALFRSGLRLVVGDTGLRLVPSLARPFWTTRVSFLPLRIPYLFPFKGDMFPLALPEVLLILDVMAEASLRLGEVNGLALPSGTREGFN
jgi:hypothetical protein